MEPAAEDEGDEGGVGRSLQAQVTEVWKGEGKRHIDSGVPKRSRLVVGPFF